VTNLVGYTLNSEKASVLRKQMLAIYHEDLVAQVISNEKLWEMTGQININKEIRKRKFGSVRMIANLAR
jgi:hypothetical protein